MSPLGKNRGLAAQEVALPLRQLELQDRHVDQLLRFRV